MYVLGVSAYSHDSAAVLVKDGEVRWAIEEERLSRIKHDGSFPVRAIRRCLELEGISISEVNVVAYYERPLRRFERILSTLIRKYPWGLRAFVDAMTEWLTNKIRVEYRIRMDLGFKGEIVFSSHHFSHACAAFYTSSFASSAVLTVDGVGEYETTVLWQADGSGIRPLASLQFPHSLGIFYSTCTGFLGFRVNEDEYKVMGLAALGVARYVDALRDVLKIDPDGSFRLNETYFDLVHATRMWSSKFESVFGGPRHEGDEITAKHRDLAASVQVIQEEAYLGLLKALHMRTGSNAVCIGGGVALNAKANGKMLGTEFDRAHIFTAAGDAGGALGAALSVSHKDIRQNADACLGAHYTDTEIRQAVEATDLEAECIEEEVSLISKASELLSQGLVIGWFQGRAEFGPRALGNRSILADPRNKRMKDKVNQIKGREPFRPFGGSLLELDIRKYLHVPTDQSAFPYMNICFDALENPLTPIDAIVHDDGSVRVQTVTATQGRFHRLLTEFNNRTGSSCVLNTSFNRAGEPLVETPADALNMLQDTPLDAVVIGNYIVRKSTMNKV